MPASNVLGALPDAYHLEHDRRGYLAVRRDLWPAFRRAGYHLGGRGQWPAGELEGRRPMGEIRVENERFVVRRFHHGGLLRWLTGPRFADPARPFHELRLSARLRALGVETPEVVAARAESLAPFGWRLDLVTRLLPGVWDGAELLEWLRSGEPGSLDRRRSLQSLGERIGHLHRIGFLHADLTPRNLLIERVSAQERRPSVWVLDLDRSRFVAAVDDATRRSNLGRLYRAVRRREARGRGFLRRSDYLHFLRGYGEGWGEAGWSWREDWRAIRLADERALRWHRLGWVAEELLGGGAEQRDGRARVRRP